MKIRFCLILPLLIILCLCSCASSPAPEGGAVAAGTETQVNHKEKKQNHKKLLFEDWKYRGFGQSLPVWFEAAYKDDVAGVQKSDAQLSDREIVIIRGDGVNSDQADKVLKIKQEEISSDFILYDSCWARKTAGDYVALAVLYR